MQEEMSTINNIKNLIMRTKKTFQQFFVFLPRRFLFSVAGVKLKDATEVINQLAQPT